MTNNSQRTTELVSFEQSYDTSREDKAVYARGRFLREFPVSRLKNLSIDDYIIGKGKPSFCAFVEAKTKAWANIQGATSDKFGIYFGRTKSDPIKKYRFTKKFGDNKSQAFRAVKSAVVALVTAGRARRYSEIDSNPLSQMFKAKILSLYFPDLYLNICSGEHLELLASELALPEQPYFSGYQHLLIKNKLANKTTRSWSNPKFMSFLYGKYIRQDLNPATATVVKKLRKKSHRRVNLGDIADERDAIGKLSEEFALEWEKSRLIGLGHRELVSQIDDRRDSPSYGYDFLSHSRPGLERYIEVKSVGKDRNGGGFRFFLSENERLVLHSAEHREAYYFYLVRYGSSGTPRDLVATRAKELLDSSSTTPCAYVVRFNFEEQK